MQTLSFPFNKANLLCDRRRDDTRSKPLKSCTSTERTFHLNLPTHLGPHLQFVRIDEIEYKNDDYSCKSQLKD